MSINQSRKHGQFEKIKALLNAAKIGHQEMVDSLLQQKVFVDSTDPDDLLQNTPLHLASEYGHSDIVQLLINQGADIERRRQDKHARTPLHLAAANGHTKVVKVLLEQGAAIDETGKVGMTALYRAATKNHVNVVRVLLLYGADIYKTDNLLGMTTLQTAILNNNLAVVKLLTIYASFSSYLTEAYIVPLIQQVKKEYAENQIHFSSKKINLSHHMKEQIHKAALALWKKHKNHIQENLKASLPHEENIASYLKEAKAFLLECLVFRIAKGFPAEENLHK